MSEDAEVTTETTDTGDADAVAAAVGTTENKETTTETTTEATDSKGWFLSEGVAGEGEAPEWFKADKYKSVDEQAKAYNELEGKFGSFTGAPDEYAVQLSEELKEKGIEIGADDPIMEEAMSFAKESGMNQEGFNKMVELYAMTKMAEETATQEVKANEIKALGQNAEKRLSNLEAWGKANMSADQYHGFEEMLQSAASVQAVERLIAMTRNAPVSPDVVSNAPTASEEEVRKMQFEKDEFGNRKIQTDPAFKERYERLRDQVWGTEEHRIIVG